MLGIQCCAATGAGCGDRLLVVRIGDITACEDAGDRGLLRRCLDGDVTGVVELEGIGHQLRSRNLPDGHE